MVSGEHFTPPSQPGERVVLLCGQKAVRGAVCAIDVLQGQRDYVISLGIDPTRAVGIHNICSAEVGGSACQNTVICGPEGSLFIESDVLPPEDAQ